MGTKKHALSVIVYKGNCNNQTHCRSTI